MPETKLQILHDTTSKVLELGDYETFQEKMKIPEKRRIFYNHASQRFNLGDFNTFEQKVLSSYEEALQRPRNEIDDKMDLLIEGKQKRDAEQETKKVDEEQFTGELEGLKLQNPLLYKEINTMAEKGESPDLIKRFISAKAASTKVAEKGEKPKLSGSFGVGGGFEPEVGIAEATDKGLLSGLTQTLGFVGTGLQYTGGKIGFDALEKLGKETYEFWEKEGEKHIAPEELQGSILENPKLLTKGTWWAYNIAQMSPSLLASMIPAVGTAKYINVLGKTMKFSPPVMARLARLAPSIVGGITGGSLEGSHTYQEILNQGGTKEEAEAGMEMMTLAAGALNALSLDVMLKKMPPGLKSAMTKYIVSGATEGFTEWAEEPSEALIKMKLGYATPKEVWEQTKAGVNVAPIAAVTGGLGAVAFNNLPGISEPVKETFTKPEKVEELKPEVPKEPVKEVPQKPPEVSKPVPTIPEAKKVSPAKPVQTEEGKETVLTKIKKRGRTYDVVKKPDGSLILRSKTDVLPYSYGEYNKYIKRVEAGRKAMKTKTEYKKIFKPGELTDRPALGSLVGEGMRIRTGVGNDSRISEELERSFKENIEFFESKITPEKPAAKLRAEKGFLRIGIEPKKTAQFKFSSPETEQRYQSAKGLRVENILPRIKSNLRSFWHKVSREYEHLPRTKEFARLRFGLLRLSKQKGVASDKTIREINDITDNLNKDEYDLFNRKVITADLLEMAEEEKSLPYGFEKEILETDSKSLDSFVAENKNISGAIKKRGEVWNKVKKEYTESMKSIGYDVSEKLTRKNYFRHQVLDYARMKSLWGTGKRLKTPAARGFLRKRYGSKLDINADYLQAEHEVMAQMTYDIQVAKTIKKIDDNYNIYDELKKEAKKQKTDWHNLIPEGYVEWQPREGNLFYLADTIPSKLAEQLASSMIEKIGVSKEQVNKALAMGGKRKELIVKEEVALTLDNLVKERTSNAISETHKSIIRKWKQWQLISPRRFFKYNSRNLTGDADAAFAGSPSVFLKTQKAVKELYNVYVSDKKLTGNVKDWFDRGGTISTLQAQEMDELNKLNTFVELRQDVKRKEVPKEIWKKYWKTARITTDFREATLRYAAYLDYLEQMEKNPEGKPKNFGASKPEEIMGLDDIKDRAYWLSNDLLGAYDKVSVYGQSLREHIYPFWSWKEVNFKRYVQMFRNAASDEKFCRTVGRKTIGSIATTPFKLYRIGKFVIKASAFVSATSLLWNKMIMGDDDDELPDDVRNRPHITFGKDEDGNVMYFTRIGALGDLLEWFNLDAAPFYVDQFRKGKMSIKEIAKDMAKAPLNMFIQGVEPFTKTTAELITRRSLYPDLFAPGTVRDRGLHVARSFGIADEYIALTGKPSRGYKKTISKFFIYKSDPLESAYWDVLDEKRRFLKSKGKIYEGFWLTPRGNVLYNLKLALRFGDKKSADDYLTEYIKLGGTEKGLDQSFNMMDPTYGLKDDEDNEFAEYLGKEGLEKMAKALVFYDDLLNSKTELAGKFPGKYTYK